MERTAYLVGRAFPHGRGKSTYGNTDYYTCLAWWDVTYRQSFRLYNDISKIAYHSTYSTIVIKVHVNVRLSYQKSVLMLSEITCTCINL